MKKLILLSALGVNSILTYAQFTPIGPGNYSNDSYVILVDGSNVYADGFFTSGSTYFSYGKFDGTNWNKLGNWGLVIGLLNCSIKIGNDIYLGGSFTDATGDPNMDNIARYNTTTNTWYPLGNGLNGMVQSVIQMGTDILVAGNFTNAGGDPNADFIAKWNGTSWSALTNTVISSYSGTFVNDMIIYNNELYIGGNFSGQLLKFNGSSFINVPGWNFSSAGAVVKFAIDGNNNLYVVTESNNIYKFNGSSWQTIPFTGTIPPGNYLRIRDIVANGTDLYIGGSFLDAMGISNADYLIKYDANSNSWSSIGSGLNDNVNDMTISGGILYIAGKFTDAGGNVAADKLIKYNLSASSVSEFTKDIKIQIFPNPSNGTFTIQTEKGGIFELTDITGRVINTYTIKEKSYTINEELPDGMYFIREKESGAVQKLVIE